MTEPTTIKGASPNAANAVGRASVRVGVGRSHPLGILTKEDWMTTSEEISKTLSKVGIKWDEIKIKAHEDGLEGSMKFDFLDIEAPGVSVTRSFFRDGGDLVAYHSLLELDAGLQGRGVSKGIISALLPAYKKMGVDRIEVHANMDVGGYTWARYGFKADARQARRLAGQIEDDGLAKKASAIVEDFYKSHKADEGFPVNLIASHSWGKKALLGTEWGGYVDLHDKAQVAVFKRYASS